jgi:PcfJ-like protein
MSDQLKDYKIAVYFGRKYSYERTFICSCGASSTITREEPLICKACGNDNAIRGGDYVVHERRLTHGIFTCVEKTDSYFHLKKKEMSVNVRNMKVTFRFTHDWELKFSLRDRSAALFKDGKQVSCGLANYMHINQFFKWGHSEDELIPVFATEKNQPLYEFIYLKFGSEYPERVDKLGRALIRALAKPYLPRLELFANAGFGKNLSNIFNYDPWISSAETKPHRIFGVPKYMLSILREIGTFGKGTIKNLQKLDELIGGNNVRIMAEIFKEESTVTDMVHLIGQIIELYTDYGYKDVKRLALYLAREVKLEQGITSPHVAATTLRDYVRMCHAMGIEPKEKYPKSLKKSHDIAQMNYKAKEDEYKNMMMKAVVAGESYQSLTYRKDRYAIIAPKDSSDLIQEGSSLSHCVASYVDDVIAKRCKILFLRETAEIDKPLVTIEVRDNNIRQVRGFGNRSASPEELDFVREWAKKKGLVLATY